VVDASEDGICEIDADLVLVSEWLALCRKIVDRHQCI